MPPILDRKLRFADAVYAIEATPKSLRNWLARDQVTLPFGHPREGWHEFTFIDIAVLAVVRKLVDFGMPVETASQFANSVLLASLHRLSTFKNAPPMAVVSLFFGQRMRVWRGAEGWHYRVDRQEDGEPATAVYLTLNVSMVLDAAITRAMSSRADGAE
ncbi:MAG: hypothetical protein IT555_10135 [Acetobacteraceae bacterium]|nr:hypothetical protein [Acetobacteraceae bacterium]